MQFALRSICNPVKKTPISWLYEGKLKREEVLAQTPAAPWQSVREFCTERPHTDSPSAGSGQAWRNLLVWGNAIQAFNMRNFYVAVYRS